MRLIVPLWALGLGSLLLIAAALVLLRLIRREETLTARVALMRTQALPRLPGTTAGTAAAAEEEAKLVRPPLHLRFMASIGTALVRSGALPAKTVAELQGMLAQAGLRGGNGLFVFLGAKMILLPGLPLLLFFLLPRSLSPMMFNAALATAAVMGLVLPDWWVKRRRKRYLKALEDGLADALDLLVICSEAGLGLEPGIDRVGAEIRNAHPEVASEFVQTASELRILSDRRVALQNLGARTGIDSLRRLGGTLVQTMQYGTPLATALRTLSVELRAEMLNRFEARAARLPVLLTLPMIIFILPCVFLVIMGPTAVRVMATWK